MRGPPARVLLLSGLPLRRPSSFSRQLSLLARFLRPEGWEALLLGPESGRSGRSMQGFGSLEPWVRRTGAKAAILLGYPDQFPFLRGDPSIPLFLWAQFSRPPDPASLGAAFCVPLTGRTEQFIAAAGGRRLQPVIPHGVDTRFFRPLPSGRRRRLRRKWNMEGRFVVGSVGAHTARKRFELILEAFSLLSVQRDDAFLVLKTDRPVSPEGSDLRRLARRLGIEGRMRLLTGELSPKKLRDLYNLVDVYLNLSEWEGFCLPVVEAMACGLPVVTHPVQGPGETVPYRDLQVEGGEAVTEAATRLLHARPGRAAHTLLRAAERPELLRKLSRAGLREAGQRYDIRSVAHRWAELLERFCL